MAAILPRHVLCVLGAWRDLAEVEAIIRREGGAGFELDREFSQTSADGRMAGAFEACWDRVAPTVTEGDRRAVREHTAVAYILSPPLPKANAVKISGRTLLLAAALLRAGAVAVKGESAGIAHGRERWLELASEYTHSTQQNDSHAAGAVLHQSWVRRPLLDDDSAVYYSCGMHLLGEPDVEYPTGGEVGEALRWLDLMGLYLVADRPTRALKDGEGFRLATSGPRRLMRFVPCQRYATDDFFFNPYGYVRLVSE